ncbi:hypothetical protein [Cupriavidus basilensis]|jgi:hypothetical protein|uniref:hypothetical protein n=1 Tax=Cupriavidus basilensis TaxID=68895 RepID=UPI0023E77A3E|nr:hypothetical protein [Cupriavidus basilensis]MDF3885017.1 hypothetical protein [Cupriavidus basilensis]
MSEPTPFRFTATQYGFHARHEAGNQACFLEPLLNGKQVVWQWRIHSADMASRLAEGTSPTPDRAEAAMRAWLAGAA